MSDNKFHLHLVSDSTGETVNTMARAVCAQFDNVKAIEHIYGLVRGDKQLEKTVTNIALYPGPVFFSLVNPVLRDRLESACVHLRIPCLSVLDPFIQPMATFLNVPVSGKTGAKHTMDQEYFQRITALNYTMAHDDGQSQGDLDEADIILTGVSRTSKTPTCMYLANRGFKTANVPLVPGIDPPPELLAATRPLIVGLTTTTERLTQIRKNRLLTLQEQAQTDYIDPEIVQKEITDARRLFARKNWSVIDVSRRSIEEVAAAVMNLYQEHSDREPA
ncbi:kinase/pyrophosphorylase [Alphaproteobacteria bacterium]|nr:kinase/pyrophosphorylase [Alphaproteobacteria bacterium]